MSFETELNQLNNIIDELKRSRSSVAKECSDECRALWTALQHEYNCAREIVQQLSQSGTEHPEPHLLHSCVQQVLSIALKSQHLVQSSRKVEKLLSKFKNSPKHELQSLTEQLCKIQLDPFQAAAVLRIKDSRPLTITSDRLLALGFVNLPSNSSLWVNVNQKLECYDTNTKQMTRSFEWPRGKVLTCIAVSRRGEIWTGHLSGFVAVHRSNSHSTPLMLLSGRITTISFDEDEKGSMCTAWIGDDAGNVRLCNVDQSGEPRVDTVIAPQQWQHHGGNAITPTAGPVTAILVHKNRALVATGGSNPCLLMWGTSRGSHAARHNPIDGVEVKQEIRLLQLVQSKRAVHTWHHYHVITAQGPNLTVWCVDDSRLTPVATLQPRSDCPAITNISGIHLFPRYDVMVTIHEECALLWPLPSPESELIRPSAQNRYTPPATHYHHVTRIKLKDRGVVVASANDAEHLAIAWPSGQVLMWDAGWIRRRAELYGVEFPGGSGLAPVLGSGGNTSSSFGSSRESAVHSIMGDALSRLSSRLSWGLNVSGVGTSEEGAGRRGEGWEGEGEDDEGRQLVQDLVPSPRGRQEGAGQNGVGNGEGHGGAVEKSTSQGTEEGGEGGPRSSVENSRCPVIRLEDLTFKAMIGAGSYGEVQLAQWQFQEVAVKQLKLNSTESPEKLREILEDLEKEVQMLYDLVYFKSFVRLTGWCPEPPMIITEYYENGSLFANLKLVRENTTNAAGHQHLRRWLHRLKIAQEIAAGMLQMHSLKPPLIHGDLRSPNIFLTGNWEPRIGDLGLARVLQRDDPTAHSGDASGSRSPSDKSAFTNPRSMDPAAYATGRVTQETDIYAFGIILWELLTFKIPYDGQNTLNVLMQKWNLGKGEQHHPPLQKEEDLPHGPYRGLEQYNKLMLACWHHDPLQRPSFRHIANELQKITNKAKVQEATQNLIQSHDHGRRGLADVVMQTIRERTRTVQQSVADSMHSPRANMAPPTCHVCGDPQAHCSCLYHPTTQHPNLHPHGPPAGTSAALHPTAMAELPSSIIVGVPSGSTEFAPSTPSLNPSTSTPPTSIPTTTSTATNPSLPPSTATSLQNGTSLPCPPTPPMGPSDTPFGQISLQASPSPPPFPNPGTSPLSLSPSSSFPPNPPNHQDASLPSQGTSPFDLLPNLAQDMQRTPSRTNPSISAAAGPPQDPPQQYPPFPFHANQAISSAAAYAHQVPSLFVPPPPASQPLTAHQVPSLFAPPPPASQPLPAHQVPSLFAPLLPASQPLPAAQVPSPFAAAPASSTQAPSLFAPTAATTQVPSLFTPSAAASTAATQVPGLIELPAIAPSPFVNPPDTPYMPSSTAPPSTTPAPSTQLHQPPTASSQRHSPLTASTQLLSPREVSNQHVPSVGCPPNNPQSPHNPPAAPAQLASPFVPPPSRNAPPEPHRHSTSPPAAPTHQPTPPSSHLAAPRSAARPFAPNRDNPTQHVSPQHPGTPPAAPAQLAAPAPAPRPQRPPYISPFAAAPKPTPTPDVNPQPPISTTITTPATYLPTTMPPPNPTPTPPAVSIRLPNPYFPPPNLPATIPPPSQPPPALPAGPHLGPIASQSAPPFPAPFQTSPMNAPNRDYVSQPQHHPYPGAHLIAIPTHPGYPNTYHHPSAHMQPPSAANAFSHNPHPHPQFQYVYPTSAFPPNVHAPYPYAPAPYTPIAGTSIHMQPPMPPHPPTDPASTGAASDSSSSKTKSIYAQLPTTPITNGSSSSASLTQHANPGRPGFL